jgi:hypothetical protein
VRSCTVKSDLESDAYVRVVGLLDDLGRSEERVGPDIDRPVTHAKARGVPPYWAESNKENNKELIRAIEMGQI